MTKSLLWVVLVLLNLLVLVASNSFGDGWDDVARKHGWRPEYVAAAP